MAQLYVNRMNSARPIQFVIYLLAVLVLGYLTFISMMWGVWGAPVHPSHYIALLGALAIFVGAFITLARPGWGRLLGLVGLAAMGSLWIPGIVEIVPQHNVIISPAAYLAFLLYFAAIGFALLYPRRWRWSLLAFVVVLCVAIGFVAVTTVSRVRAGEYARPSFAYFRWYPGAATLAIEHDSDAWVDSEARSMLERAGIHGRLEWIGSSGERRASHRIILLAQSQPSSVHELRYPRDGVLIYAYDGEKWRIIPEGAATFSSFATIEPQNSSTMLWQDAAGGRQGTAAFTW